MSPPHILHFKIAIINTHLKTEWTLCLLEQFALFIPVTHQNNHFTGKGGHGFVIACPHRLGQFGELDRNLALRIGQRAVAHGVRVADGLVHFFAFSLGKVGLGSGQQTFRIYSQGANKEGLVLDFLIDLCNQLYRSIGFSKSNGVDAENDKADDLCLVFDNTRRYCQQNLNHFYITY